MTDPKQWDQIADAWDQLAGHAESLSSPEWQKDWIKRLRDDDAHRT
jgi:hypothetical protein